MSGRPVVTELAARVLANEAKRHREKLSHAHFLSRHGWKNIGPFHWIDWKTGTVHRAREAYELEIDRQEQCASSRKMVG